VLAGESDVLRCEARYVPIGVGLLLRLADLFAQKIGGFQV
jgi:hypothetical protein